MTMKTGNSGSVQVKQLREGRFCVFQGSVQIAAIEAAAGAPAIERYGDRVFSAAQLQALADTVLASGPALGSSQTLVLSGAGWQVQR
jgi:hypothetical protein